ncbi:hypothetical protein EVAR_101256_1 [Eumeta japonica]|uniref:Uncharacterized protein n=1 Tax=Eumeta variegata TaxID=151549 RepID=A0A4C1SNK9_EUMVA|nr:hypothetical protein EVAR_101256_1 [Eumeta japonica]
MGDNHCVYRQQCLNRRQFSHGIAQMGTGITGKASYASLSASIGSISFCLHTPAAVWRYESGSVSFCAPQRVSFTSARLTGCDKFTLRYSLTCT